MAQENPYLQLVESDLTNEVKRSMQVAVDRDPDTEARLHDLAKRAKVPLEAVRLDPKPVERQVAFEAVDYETLAKQYPSTAQMLADPDGAALAKDDIENMSMFEKLVGAGKRGLLGLNQGASAVGLKSNALAMSNVEAIERRMAAGEAIQDGEDIYGVRLMTPQQRDDFKASLSITANRQAGDIASLESRKRAIPTDPTITAAVQSKTFGEFWTHFTKKPFEFIATVGAESLPNMLPGLAAAVPATIAGGPVAGAATLGGSSFGVDYAGTVLEAMQSEGVDLNDEAAVRAAVTDRALMGRIGQKAFAHASVVGAFDAVSAGIASKTLTPAKLASRPVLKNAVNLAVQSPVQGLFGALGEAGGQVAAGDDFQAGSIAAEFFGEFVGAPGEVLSMSGRKIIDTMQQARAARENVAVMQALGEAAGQSKLLDRAPERFREFIKKAKEGGEIRDVFIPVAQFNAYFQSVGVDPAQVATEVGATNYQEAIAAGTDVIIPLENYATSIAPTEFHSGLIQDIRLHQGDMTQREADQFEAERESAMQRIMADAREAAPLLQNDSATAQIESDILGQLIASGTERGTAETYAKTYAKAIANLATRSGMDPLALHERYGLTINRPMPDILTNRIKTDINLDPLLDRMRAGDMPSDADIFGPSLTEFIRSIGGMRDDGGELRRMEVDANNSPFMRNLIQVGGRAIDEVTALAQEAGYQVDDILDAIDAEVRGNPVYAAGKTDESLLELRETVNQLGQYLSSIGVDVSGMTNEQIRKVMDDVLGNVYGQGLTLDSVKEAWSAAGVKGSISESADRITLSQIIVPESERGTGKGSEAMRALIAYADAAGKHVVLTPSADFGGNKKRLTEFYKRFGFVENKGKNRAFSTMESMYRLAPGKVLYQDETRLNKEADRNTMRGYIQFGADRKFNIALLEKADLSTFLHESGHFWLEVMGDLASDPNASQEIKGDFAQVLKFLGVESREQIGVEQHELFARANEAYLREGKAPSPELRGVFQKFKAWLTMIYKSAEMLNVKLTDEVRGVFDRIYASEAEIEAARNEMDVSQLFATAADAGMTEQEFAAYSKSVASSVERAKDELRAKLMKQFQREKLAWWNGELDKLRAEVTQEIDAQPVYQAFDALTKGELPDGTPFKLDKAVLVAQFGKAYIKRLPRGYGEGRGAVFSTDGKGMHHDAAADLLGYGSGAELVQALVEMRPRKELIEAEAKQRMIERHGDLIVDGTIADEAVAAMHNEERANLLRLELRAIRKKQIQVAPFVKVERKAGEEAAAFAERERAYERRWLEAERNTQDAQKKQQAMVATDTPPVSVFREAARGMIGQQQVRDIRPYPYLLAERKASKAAFAAMAKGDFQEAAIQKQRELLNHYLYLEATAALETADDIYTYARKFTKGRTRAKFGKAGEVYLEQIDDLLDQYEFASVSKTDIVRREKLLQFVRDKMAEDEPVMIPDAVLIDAQKRNYKTLPFDQLMAVRDAIRNIEHLVDLKTKLLKVQAKRALQELVEEGAASIEEHGAKREAPVGTRTWLDSAKELRDGYFAAHRKLASLFREMDGWKDDGFMWNTFMKPINDAANEKAVRTEDATKKLAKLYEKLEKPGLANKVKGLGLLSKENYPSLGRSLSRADLLALALNYGNEGNRQRIRDGYGWTDQQVLAALNRLESHEWDFVQGMWDLIDSYWNEIAAQDKRVNGIAPEKVERSGFILPNGRRIEGGYYPIKYDERHSVRSYTDRAKEEADRILRGAVARPGVDTGFTESRAGKVIDRKIKLDLGVGLQHIDTVLQTLTHREMLIDLNRILGSTKMNGAILEHYGIETYKAVQEAIVDIAAGEIGAKDSFEAGMAWLRSGVTVAGMGLNLSTALMQPMGITQSMVRIGPKWAMRGVARFLGDALHMENAAKFAYDRSDMMRLRSKTLNREISEIRNKISKGGVMPKVEEAYFYAIIKMQAAVDVPTWLGAYEKYMEQTGNDEAKAIALADQAVIDAQGGGQTKDLAGIQRGGPLKKLFTTFYSYFSATWNLTVESAGRTDFKKVDDVVRFAVDMLLLYSIPVVLTAALKDAVNGGEGPDDDEWLAWLAKQHASFALGTMVGPREIGSAFSGMYGYSGPAGTRFFSETAKLATQAQQGESDVALVKAANNTAGILFHYPAGQVQRTSAGFMALKDGSTSNPMALVFGPRKDD